MSAGGKVANAEEQLQATLNVIPAYTWYADPSGALTFVNERLSDYLGLPKEHPLRFGIDTGASWDSHILLLHPDDQEESRRVWSTCLRTGRAGELSFRVRNAEGGYRWFLSRAEPLLASDGTLLYWIGFNLIGWFLMEAAKATYAHVQIKPALGGMQVSEITRTNYEAIARERSRRGRGAGL